MLKSHEKTIALDTFDPEGSSGKRGRDVGIGGQDLRTLHDLFRFDKWAIES